VVLAAVMAETKESNARHPNGSSRAFRRQSLAVEIRTVAGPSSVVQCVLSAGPYTVASQVRHVQVVWPPPWPRQA
jgi:hypothetical protein